MISNHKKKTPIILLTVILIAVAVGGIFFWQNAKNQTSTEEKAGTDGKKNADSSEIEEMINDLYSLNEEQEFARGSGIGTQIEDAIIANGDCTVVDYDNDSITLMVKAPDMKKIMDSYSIEDVDKYDEESYKKAVDDMSNYILESLNKKEFSTLSTEVTVDYDENGIVLSYEFVDTIYGGLLSAYEDYMKKYIEESHE